jgi:hypothetical protein
MWSMVVLILMMHRIWHIVGWPNYVYNDCDISRVIFSFTLTINSYLWIVVVINMIRETLYLLRKKLNGLSIRNWQTMEDIVTKYYTFAFPISISNLWTNMAVQCLLYMHLLSVNQRTHHKVPILKGVE